MSEEHPHPLLAQLPLTVSPFVSLPTATPLPYSYKQLPATLPPSVTDVASPQQHNASSNSDEQTQTQQPAYVISQNTGHSAHPDQIIASCQALQAHLQKLQDDAVATIQKWQNGIKERELMEKRRVAPGWLDAEQRMLVPERVGRPQPSASQDSQADSKSPGNADGQKPRDEGEELDRAFGGLGLK
ncbi:uncharacterized protein PV09_02165 [Verruconis gallopava]|uniref:Uncharacterized protein n=1 Tax=Verruconis gallopava TaxID=253628 RepID=A0A0D2ALB5_9PEZI|nr:uncharacterized protein PV09_02165 [Verruconis gallopava]KIW07315.1 hypothetical protein PV09_02165 [Verruconis gallopava]